MLGAFAAPRYLYALSNTLPNSASSIGLREREFLYAMAISIHFTQTCELTLFKFVSLGEEHVNLLVT